MIERYCLVVSNGVLKNSSDVFNILDPDSGGSQTFRVALNATGSYLDATSHYAAYTTLEPATLNALLNMTTTQFKAYVDELAIIRNRTPVGSITAFKGDVQIGAANQNPYAFIASLGLQVVRLPE